MRQTRTSGPVRTARLVSTGLKAITPSCPISDADLIALPSYGPPYLMHGRTQSPWCWCRSAR